MCGYTTTKLDFEKCPVCFNAEGQVHPGGLTGEATAPLPTGRPPGLRPAGGRCDAAQEVNSCSSFPPFPSWDGLHPLIVHFPIALLLVAPLFVVLGLARAAALGGCLLRRRWS